MSMAAQSEALLTGSISQRMQSIQTFAVTEHEEMKEIGMLIKTILAFPFEFKINFYQHLDLEPLPKTYILVKDNVEYFKPKIQVEQENPDKNDSVTEVYIRGWRLEKPILNSLQQTLPFCEKLHSLK
jgi:hypothetical protein